VTLTLNRAILVLWKENGQVNFKTFMRDFAFDSVMDIRTYKLHGGRIEAIKFVESLLDKGISKEDIAIFEPSEGSGESTCYIITDEECE